MDFSQSSQLSSNVGSETSHSSKKIRLYYDAKFKLQIIADAYSISKREIPGLNRINPQSRLFTVQHNGWCDEQIMIECIDKIWKPFVADKSISLLLLDAFKNNLT